MRTLVVLMLLLAGCFGGGSPDAEVQDDTPEDSSPFNETESPEIPVQTPAEIQANKTVNGTAPRTLERLQLPDPLAEGTLTVATDVVDFGILLVADDNVGGSPAPYTYPVQVTGHAHYPTDAPAESPVILFMHGRHATCDATVQELIFTHICPETPATSPIPNHRGYDLAASRLASHGYVVVSLNVNQVNDRDVVGDYGMQARGEVTLHALDSLQAIHDGSAAAENDLEALRGKLDLERVGLMGHSRGGEGVVEATIQNNARSEPYNLKGVFTIAPTDFGRLIPQANFATLLPYCDGDVSTLHGAWMYDDSQAQAPDLWLHQIVDMGANHNFYNTVWTNDDWGTSGDHCGGDGRHSAETQSTIGAGLVVAFMRTYVGDEALYQPYWTGHAQWPNWCDGDCDNQLHLSTRPPKSQQTVLSADGTTAGFEATCAGTDCPWSRTYTRANAAVITWSGNETISLPANGAGMDTVAFRVGLEYSRTQGELQVNLVFEDQSVTLAPIEAWFTPPGGTDAKTTLNQIRYTLDLTGLQQIDLVLTGEGRMLLADVALMDLVAPQSA